MNSHVIGRKGLLPWLVASIVLLSASATGQANAAAPAPISRALIAKVETAVDADAARLTAIFKDLHQHPEIAFTETRTAAVVAKELGALGFTVTEGIGKTGVRATMEPYVMALTSDA